MTITFFNYWLLLLQVAVICFIIFVAYTRGKAKVKSDVAAAMLKYRDDEGQPLCATYAAICNELKPTIRDQKSKKFRRMTASDCIEVELKAHQARVVASALKAAGSQPPRSA